MSNEHIVVTVRNGIVADVAIPNRGEYQRAVVEVKNYGPEGLGDSRIAVDATGRYSSEVFAACGDTVAHELHDGRPCPRCEQLTGDATSYLAAGPTTHFGPDLERPLCRGRKADDIHTTDAALVRCGHCSQIISQVALYALKMPHRFPAYTRGLGVSFGSPTNPLARENSQPIVLPWARAAGFRIPGQ